MRWPQTKKQPREAVECKRKKKKKNKNKLKRIA
ncbi:hypothetical protein QG37_08256 [Candidozyma auris]|uniref:Uncharacterized protein n=1 Tax=Candidozyma auris TaxID=498019 RepID=A0A0L0NMW9_CANAR|nr:hypothetical protein QG37_08256 [[Candida] auris]